MSELTSLWKGTKHQKRLKSQVGGGCEVTEAAAGIDWPAPHWLRTFGYGDMHDQQTGQQLLTLCCHLEKLGQQ